jgi:CDP-diacylglycerol---glycerol-3-phosphate 3-phosphatidyltransferase
MMSKSTKNEGSTRLNNLPNQLTMARLVLSVVLFGLIEFGLYSIGTVVFIVAAATDWLDGYFARKYGMVTMLGRIFDPFVDKVIVCGTFIMLVAVPESRATGLQGWMVVVIVGRELLVTALRSFLEQRGSDFSASMAGKLKMVVQCIAAGFGLFYLSYETPGDVPGWLPWVLVVSIWGAVLITVYSGVGYIRTAIRLLRG